MKRNFLLAVWMIITVNVFAETMAVKEPLGALPQMAAPTKTVLGKPSDQDLPAEQLQQPYLVELVVDNYTITERQKKIVTAFNLVLVKNSNNPKIVELAEIKTALANPERYVQKFSYLNRSIADKPAVFLRINFDAKAVTQLLQRASKVVWVNSKPLVLIWLAQDMLGGKILGNEGDNDKLSEILRKKAPALGLEIMLPTLDLPDLDRVKATDICSLNAPLLKQASVRYGVSAVVSGCIKPPLLGGLWSSRWLLLRGNENEQFGLIGTNPEDLLTQVIQQLATKIKSIATPVAGEVGVVVLRISGVNGLDQYSQIEHCLGNFNQVVQVELLSTNANEVKIAVSVRGGQAALLTVLSAQIRLVPNLDVTLSPPGIDLDYKWIMLDDEKSQPINPKPLS